MTSCSHNCPFTPEEFRDLRADVATLLANQSSQKEQQDKIYKSIEGNGKKGLRQRVEDLEVANAASGGKSAGRWQVWGVIGSIVCSSGTLIAIIYHILHLAQMAPK